MVTIDGISTYKEYFIYGKWEEKYDFCQKIIENDGSVLEMSLEWEDKEPENLEEVEKQIGEFIENFDYEGKTKGN